MQTAMDIFAIHDTLPTPDMTHVLEVLKNADAIRSYLKDIEQYAYIRLTQGLPVPGYKIVHGKSNRSWKNPQAAKDWCVEQGLDEMAINEIKFRSPAQIEKLLTKKARIDVAFTSLVNKPEGKPTMVPDTDKREPIDYRTAAELFAEIEYVEEI